MMEQRLEEKHLDYDELLKAAAGTDDQAEERREHLASCSSCQQALARVTQRFDRLGRMARKAAPAPRRVIRLPRARTAAGRRRMKPILALGTAALLLLVFGSWWVQQGLGPQTLPKVAAQKLEEDRRLMQQIDALVDNALPPAFQDLASFSGPIFDEDLINRIVPSIEEDDNSLT